MGCWAVPAVAAEIWGVSVQMVLSAVEEGRLLSRTEAGMLLVDVDPAGIGAARRRQDQRPPTYSLAAAEREPITPAAQERTVPTRVRQHLHHAMSMPHVDRLGIHIGRRFAAATRRAPGPAGLACPSRAAS
jgi:hypothetical protein